MCVLIESSSFVSPPDLAPYWFSQQVAGFHRAVPSTALDKACMQFEHILQVFFHLSSPNLSIFDRLFIILLWTFPENTGMILITKLGVERFEESSKKF